MSEATPERKRGDAAFNEVRRQIAARNDATQKAARNRRQVEERMRAEARRNQEEHEQAGLRSGGRNAGA